MSKRGSSGIHNVILSYPEELIRPVDLIDFIYEDGFFEDWEDCGLSVEEDLWDLEIAISADPEGGAVIKGGGGLRKLRWIREGMGKSGGMRVLYVWIPEIFIAYVYMAYSKSEKDNISKGVLSKICAEIGQTRQNLIDAYGD